RHRDGSRHAEAHGEVEGAASSQLALGPGAAAHEPDQARRDGQAEPRAPVAAAHRAVHLREGLEDRGEPVGGNADPGVADTRMDLDVTLTTPGGLDGHRDLS